VGHDLPILVREMAGAGSAPGTESLAKWTASQARSADYPPTQDWVRAAGGGEEFYCSLGNGHFFQALNLFGTQWKKKFDDDGKPTEMVRPWCPRWQYDLPRH
jgi:hypothetical protein